MTEPLRRLTIDTELPERLALEIEDAVVRGEFETVGQVVEGALSLWSFERWPRLDPDSWRAHVEEVRASVAEADAHPEDDMDVDEFFRELQAEMEIWSDASTPAKAAG